MSEEYECTVCQAPLGASYPLCEECCPYHYYKYDAWERQHICITCGKPAPEDFYRDE